MSRIYKKPSAEKDAVVRSFKPNSTPVQRSCCGNGSMDSNVQLQRAAGLGHGLALPGGAMLQTQLTLGPADDSYEREADSVAKDVVQQISSPQVDGEGVMAKRVQREDDLEEDVVAPKRVQRMEELDEEMVETKRVQRDAMTDGGAISSDIESSIEGARGGGAGLDEGTRSSMEGAFNADFSSVKVHTDSASDSLNQSLQSKAFTTGQDIFFRQGEFSPQSSGGQELLAHELTHVVQQNGDAVQKKDDDAS